MRLGIWMMAAGILAVAVGCGDSGQGEVETKSESKPVVQSDGRSPEEVVAHFFEGLRRGDEEQVLSMLTVKARQNDVVNCEPSDATYHVGAVQYHEQNKDIAYVESTWTLYNEEGEPETDEATWALRREPQGWRIAGTIMKVAALDGHMVPLDFEKPEAMEETKRQVAEEIARRLSETYERKESVAELENTEESTPR